MVLTIEVLICIKLESKLQNLFQEDNQSQKVFFGFYLLVNYQMMQKLQILKKIFTEEVLSRLKKKN